MGSKLSILLVFLITFIGVAGSIYFLNQKYNNIFVGDFRPAPDPVEMNRELGEKFDSLNTYFRVTRIDTFFIYQDTTLISEMEEAQKLIAELRNQLAKKDQTIRNIEGRISTIQTQNTAVQDSTREEWLQSTVKLLQTMDARRAARIIEKYNEPLARDIIYKMKKKKAGEILSQLNPDLATKLTGVKQ